MSDDLDLGAGLSALTTLLLSEETLDTTLRQVAEIATKCVASGAGATIVLVDRNRPFTAFATDERSAAVDACQFEAGEAGDGPTIEAIRNSSVMVLDGSNAEDRWLSVVSHAAACGVLSLLAVPLVVRDAVFGTLNIYSEKPSAFSPDAVETARLLASQAAVTVANARTHDECAARITQLQQALDTRVVIEQAKGVLMERNGISSERAFTLLRKASQTDNRKLRDVAGELVGSFEA